MTAQTHEGRTLNEAAATKLRVLQRMGVKAAIKLEKIYWSQLDEIAKEQKITTARLVFTILENHKETINRTSILRCYCLECARARASVSRLQAESFDMLGVIAACPSPVAVITPQRKIAAFNPAFSTLISNIRGNDRSQGTAIQFSFGEIVPKIYAALLSEPRRIVSHQVGVQIGAGRAHFFMCRFALAERTKGNDSLIILFFEVTRRIEPPKA